MQSVHCLYFVPIHIFNWDTVNVRVVRADKGAVFADSDVEFYPMCSGVYGGLKCVERVFRMSRLSGTPMGRNKWGNVCRRLGVWVTVSHWRLVGERDVGVFSRIVSGCSDTQ